MKTSKIIASVLLPLTYKLAALLIALHSYLPFRAVINLYKDPCKNPNIFYYTICEGDNVYVYKIP